jgi:hypothetical protein
MPVTPHLNTLGDELHRATRRETRRRRRQVRATATGFLALLLVGGASAIAGVGPLAQSGPATPEQTAVFESIATRADACARANGTTTTPAGDGSSLATVHYSEAAISNCGMLYLAENAASILGGRDGTTAAWLASFGPTPTGFLDCIAADGFHTIGATGARYDYGSAEFARTVDHCATTTGVTVPAR